MVYFPGLYFLYRRAKGVRDPPHFWINENKCAFDKQSSFSSVARDGVFGPPPLVRHTLQHPCLSDMPKATQKGNIKGPLNDALSAQKAFQGSATETN